MNYPELINVFSKRIKTPEGSYALIDSYFLIKNKISAKSIKDTKFIFANNAETFINNILYCIPMLTSENKQISITKVCATIEIGYYKNDIFYSESYSTEDLMNPIYKVDEKLFKIVGNKKEIFSYIDTDDLCELERKIKLADSRIGQALKYKYSRKLFKYMRGI